MLNSTNGGSASRTSSCRCSSSSGGQRVEARGGRIDRGALRSTRRDLRGRLKLKRLYWTLTRGVRSSADLLEKMKQTPGLQWIGSTKSMATFLGKLDLVSRQDPKGKQVGLFAYKRGPRRHQITLYLTIPRWC